MINQITSKKKGFFVGIVFSIGFIINSNINNVFIAANGKITITDLKEVGKDLNDDKKERIDNFLMGIFGNMRSITSSYVRYLQNLANISDEKKKKERFHSGYKILGFFLKEYEYIPAVTKAGLWLHSSDNSKIDLPSKINHDKYETNIAMLKLIPRFINSIIENKYNENKKEFKKELPVNSPLNNLYIINDNGALKISAGTDGSNQNFLRQQDFTSLLEKFIPITESNPIEEKKAYTELREALNNLFLEIFQITRSDFDNNKYGIEINKINASTPNTLSLAKVLSKLQETIKKSITNNTNNPQLLIERFQPLINATHIFSKKSIAAKEISKSSRATLSSLEISELYFHDALFPYLNPISSRFFEPFVDNALDPDAEEIKEYLEIGRNFFLVANNNKENLKFLDKIMYKDEISNLMTEQSNLQKTVSNLNSTINNLKKDNDSLTRQNNFLQKEVKSLTEEKGNLTKQIQDLEEDKKKEKQKKENLRKEVESLTQEKGNLTSQISNLTMQRNSLESDKTNLVTEKTTLEANNQDLTSKNTNLTTQNINLTAQNTNLTIQNTNLLNEKKQSDDARVKAEEAQKKAEKELQEEKEKIKQIAENKFNLEIDPNLALNLEDDPNQLKEKNDKLMAKMEEAQVKITKTDEQLQATQKQLQEMKEHHTGKSCNPNTQEYTGFNKFAADNSKSLLSLVTISGVGTGYLTHRFTPSNKRQKKTQMKQEKKMRNMNNFNSEFNGIN